MSALAFPNIQRRAPITVAADTPILHVFQPVSKATLADALRHPVDGIVVADEILLYLRHFDEPGIAGIVDERCAAAPAVRIAMLKYRRAEQQAARFQFPEHFLVRFFVHTVWGIQTFLTKNSLHYALNIMPNVILFHATNMILTETLRFRQQFLFWIRRLNFLTGLWRNGINNVKGQQNREN